MEQKITIEDNKIKIVTQREPLVEYMDIEYLYTRQKGLEIQLAEVNSQIAIAEKGGAKTQEELKNTEVNNSPDNQK